MNFSDIFSKIRKAQPRPEEAPTHWVKCDNCHSLMYYKEVEACFNVCPKCGYHMRLKADDRINLICDEGSFVEFDANLKPVDPLNFVDKKSYKKRITENKEKTGRTSSVICGEGKCNGQEIQLVVFDFGFMGGSLASVEGEKIVRAIKRAIEKRQTLIIVSASGGARMQEGIYSLMQMAKISTAVQAHHLTGLLYITVLTDPTTGGVTASFAMQGDIIISEPKAIVGFAGKRVIEQTMKEKLPDDFQQAETVQANGFIDAIIHRTQLKETLKTLLSLHSLEEEFR